jgi:two-component system chemotaxis response regulator CheB
MKASVRVLIADDSETSRAALVALLALDAGIVVVGQAKDGVEVVELAKELKPDIITMDLQMPRLGGLEAIGAIMVEAPSRILVICAVDDDKEVDLSFRAVAAGALELIAKPKEDFSRLRSWGKEVCEAVQLMAEIPVVRRRRPSSLSDRSPLRHGRIDALGIVASTGGPPALAAIFEQLARDLPIPLLVAQHIGPGFSAGLRRWFSSVTPLPVLFAVDGAACRPGCIYLPPDGHDLEVDAEGLLRVRSAGTLHCPSANRLLVSIAEAYGSRGGALVLTGMGDDGVTGVDAILRVGGVALAQDEASSVVYGMPRAALERGATCVPFVHLAGTIRELCSARPDTIRSCPKP